MDWTIAGSKPSGRKMINNALHKARLGFSNHTNRIMNTKTVPPMSRGEYSSGRRKYDKPAAIDAMKARNIKLML